MHYVIHFLDQLLNIGYTGGLLAAWNYDAGCCQKWRKPIFDNVQRWIPIFDNVQRSRNIGEEGKLVRVGRIIGCNRCVNIKYLVSKGHIKGHDLQTWGTFLRLTSPTSLIGKGEEFMEHSWALIPPGQNFVVFLLLARECLSVRMNALSICWQNGTAQFFLPLDNKRNWQRRAEAVRGFR